MDSSVRDQLVSDVKNLQKITRTLQKSSARIGTTNDTVSWRETFNFDLQKGIDLVSSIQSQSQRIRSESIDAQADKLLQQNDPIIRKFNELRSNISNKLQQNEPINDKPTSNPFGGGGGAYGDDDGGAYGQNGGYHPPAQQQQQQQIDDLGLVGIAADLDHLEEQNKAMVKVADDVVQLKEAFTDLNTLVKDQGDDITYMKPKQLNQRIKW